MFVTDSIKLSGKDICNHYFNKKTFERLTNMKASKPRWIFLPGPHSFLAESRLCKSGSKEWGQRG